MKEWVLRYLPQRKAVLIAGLSIIVSSLILAQLSIWALRNQHSVIKQLIQSNLRISGEALIARVENRILELEAEIFKDKNLGWDFRPDAAQSTMTNGLSSPSQLAERVFALDSNYNILDRTRPDAHRPIDPVEYLDAFFNPDLRKAEEAEFKHNDYLKALVYYRNGLTARTPSERAQAQDGLARCLVKLGRYDRAEKAYRELADKYPLLLNRAQTPFGLTARWQVYSLQKQQNRAKAGLSLLLHLYQELLRGEWPIDEEQYEFYETKLADELSALLRDAKDNAARLEFQNTQRLKTERLAHVRWIKALRAHLVPQLKSLSATAKPTQKPHNLSMTIGDETYVIAYQKPDDADATLLGFKLSENYVKSQILPEAFNGLNSKQGVNVRIGNLADETMWEHGHVEPRHQSVTLKFNDVLTSWKLIISASEDALAKAAQREFWAYIGFLSLIICTLILGIFLLLRDVARELELSKIKADFVSNVSHELRTPLTVIRLYGETLLLDENFNQEERKEFYRIITSESERLMHLINNVLDFSRIDSGEKSYHFDHGDIAAAVKSTIEAYKHQLAKKGFRIITEIEEDVPPMTFDKDAISQALLNLMNNALKYSRERKEIKIRLLRQGNMICIQVADQGIGIAKEEQEKIFDKFYRSRDRRVAEVAGSGLGLTLVKHIAEAHGGSISVVSDLSKGSVFTLNIPVDQEKTRDENRKVKDAK